MCSYSLLRVTHHTVLNNSAFEKGKDRALDLLPQKTVARLEVLRPVPCKFFETRTREAGSNLSVPDACVDKNPFFFEFPVDKRLSVVQDDSEKIITKLESKFDQIFLDAFGEYGAPEEVTNTFFYKT